MILEQRNIAEQSSIEATRQAKVADENFQLAFDAVDEYLTQVSEERLLNEPGMETLRQELLNSAKKFFETFINQRNDDPKVRQKYVGATYQLAKINAEVDSKEKAIELLERIIAESSVWNLESVDPELIYRLVLIYQATWILSGRSRLTSTQG